MRWLLLLLFLLLLMFTVGVVISVANGDDVATCESARTKCAFRTGCGMALQSYMVGCADVMAGRSRRCSDQCGKTLIALTSTDEGEALMRCDCRGDGFCEATVRRVEVCRADVVRATRRDSVVSCSVAQWICAADPLCSTALDYYRRFCRGMFTGHKCTPRCNNSIAILNRQEKAAKLRNCVCDGSEDYDCSKIRKNMHRLCFREQVQRDEDDDDDDDGGVGNNNNNNDVDVQGDSPPFAAQKGRCAVSGAHAHRTLDAFPGSALVSVLFAGVLCYYRGHR